MDPSQYLRIVWARKWLVLGLFLVIAAAGIATTLLWPKQYTAETSLIVEMRIDPALGALAPALAAPSYMATQVEVLKSERVASRAVKILGVERSPTAVAQWREATSAKIPLERYFANVLERGLAVEPTRGSNLINLSLHRRRSDLRPGRGQRLRPGLHGRLGRPAGRAGTPVRRLPRGAVEDAARQPREGAGDAVEVPADQGHRRHRRAARPGERPLLGAASAQLAVAQAERVDAATRQRNSGGETSPDVLQSAGGARPQGAARRRGNEAQRSQQSARQEPSDAAAARGADRRAAGASSRPRPGGSPAAHRSATAAARRRWASCRRWSTSRRSCCSRCVPTRTRSPSMCATSSRRSAPTTPSPLRLTQINMEGQNSQANTRLLSPAVEPLEPSRPKILIGIVASLLGGLVARPRRGAGDGDASTAASAGPRT